MSTERSQGFPRPTFGPCHKDNGWVCAGIKLKRTQRRRRRRALLFFFSFVKVGSLRKAWKKTVGFKWPFSSRCIEHKVACLLLLWLIKTLNRGGRGRERKRETKGGRERERELCLFPFRIHLQERNYGWLVCSGGRADRYGGRKKEKKQKKTAKLLKTPMQSSSLMAYNTLTLHSLWTPRPLRPASD